MSHQNFECRMKRFWKFALELHIGVRFWKLFCGVNNNLQIVKTHIYVTWTHYRHVRHECGTHAFSTQGSITTLKIYSRGTNHRQVDRANPHQSQFDILPWTFIFTISFYIVAITQLIRSWDAKFGCTFASELCSSFWEGMHPRQAPTGFGALFFFSFFSFFLRASMCALSTVAYDVWKRMWSLAVTWA